MERLLSILLCLAIVPMVAFAQNGVTPSDNEGEKAKTTALKRVYDEDADPVAQIREAIEEAKTSHRRVICQVGGNWCPWCLLLADFIEKDDEVRTTIARGFVYTHVNYNPRKRDDEEKQKRTAEAMNLLGNPTDKGFPVLIVLDSDGRILTTQETGVLEEGRGYNKAKFMAFLRQWLPDSN